MRHDESRRVDHDAMVDPQHVEVDHPWSPANVAYATEISLDRLEHVQEEMRILRPLHGDSRVQEEGLVWATDRLRLVDPGGRRHARVLFEPADRLAHVREAVSQVRAEADDDDPDRVFSQPGMVYSESVPGAEPVPHAVGFMFEIGALRPRGAFALSIVPLNEGSESAR